MNTQLVAHAAVRPSPPPAPQVDTEAPDRGGSTALHRACQSGAYRFAPKVYIGGEVRFMLPPSPLYISITIFPTKQIGGVRINSPPVATMCLEMTAPRSGSLNRERHSFVGGRSGKRRPHCARFERCVFVLVLAQTKLNR